MDYGVRHLRFADYRVTKWQNGAGETREIASAAVSVGAASRGAESTEAASRTAVSVGAAPRVPASAGLGAPPHWRISMATVTQDAPFSRFPGVVRILGVVDGAGIELTVAGRSQLIGVGDEPAVFPGDVPASARPIDGPVFDLNLMVNPTRTMGRMVGIPAGTHDLAGLSWFVVALVDLELRINDREPLSLPRLDTAKLDLRAGPLVRLTLTRSDADAGAAASDAPVAYLLSISR
jgi:environmental stress-induced protein Ves